MSFPASAHWLELAVLSQLCSCQANKLQPCTCILLLLPGQDLCMQSLRMFLGEGDQYAGWEHVPMASIRLHSIAPDSVVELASAAAVQRWQKRGVQVKLRITIA